MILKNKIKKEIARLSNDHDKKTIGLINNVLLPMLQYIKDHEHIMKELTRISAKHGI